MNIEGIDAFAEELGPWIVNMAAKPYDGTTEAELFCPYHEHPEESQKPSATWQPKARSASFDLGVMRCHRPGCKLPADAREARKFWHKAQELRASGETLPEPDDDNVVDMTTWKPGSGVKPKPRTKGRAQLNEPIDDEAWETYQELLYDEPERVAYMLRERGLTSDTLRQYEWAWHQGKECYIFPVYRLDGTVEGWRLYDPFHLKDAKPRDKKRWFRTRDHHHNQLFGTRQFAGGDVVLLWEGETDTMLAKQDGIEGVSQTGGAGFWRAEFNDWFKGKLVFTCYDPDAAGLAGRERVERELQGFAKGVFHINMPDGLDYSEWRKAGHDPSEFEQLVKDAKEAWSGEPGALPTEGVPLNSVAELKDVTADRLVTLRAYVAGKKSEPWRLPKLVEVTCFQNQNKKCDNCPMFSGTRNQERKREFPLTPAQSDNLVAMMGAPDAQLFKIMASELALRCAVIGLDPREFWHVEQVSIQDPVDSGHGIMGDTRYSAYHFYDSSSSKIEQSHDYKLVGRRLSDPRSQSLAVAVWGAARTTTDLDNFLITPAMKRQLSSFRPRRPGLMWLRAKLRRKYQDLSVNVTKIASRDDLHFLYDLVAHSVHEFEFGGKVIDRGMLDALIIGDTRTGKTETINRLNSHYNIGYVVSGENSSYAGLVGGSAEMINSKERMPQWGILPRHHKRMVVIDEASGLGELLARMSDVRSSGVAKINKMGGGEVPAMVRLLWMANPVPSERSTKTRQLSEYRQGAIGALTDLVKAQEDIARFDLAMAAASDDVPADAIYAVTTQYAKQEYTADLCHSMVMFAWTRQREHILFSPEVVDLIRECAKRLAERYVAQPPLVQASNMDVKLARMCVALAVMTYSVADDGETVVVQPEHVEHIESFVRRVYDHQYMGYGEISEKQRHVEARGEESHDLVKDWLKGKKVTEFKHADIDGQDFLNIMETFATGFTMREYKDACDGMGSNRIITQLGDMGMLHRQAARFIPTRELLKIMREIERGQ
jgi:hypothetical protein